MAFAARYPIIVWLSLMFLMGQVGCALAPQGPPPPLLSDEVRESLGTIGVVSARFAPKAHLEAPTSGKGSGAAKGAAAGFFGMISGAASAGGYGGAIAILLAPVAGLVGAVVGAVEAESAATVEESAAALQNALAELKIQETMRDRVLQVAQEQTRYPFVLLEDRGLTAYGEEVRYSASADEGIDTILEVSVPKLGLLGGGVNPPLPLVMIADARLISVADGRELYAHTWKYRSGTRKFVEWAANNAQPLRDEIDRAYQSLAEQIVKELFLLYLIPGIEKESP
jgi:hypothetical protein